MQRNADVFTIVTCQRMLNQLAHRLTVRTQGNFRGWYESEIIAYQRVTDILFSLAAGLAIFDEIPGFMHQLSEVRERIGEILHANRYPRE